MNSKIVQTLQATLLKFMSNYPSLSFENWIIRVWKVWTWIKTESSVDFGCTCVFPIKHQVLNCCSSKRNTKRQAGLKKNTQSHVMVQKWQSWRWIEWGPSDSAPRGSLCTAVDDAAKRKIRKTEQTNKKPSELQGRSQLLWDYHREIEVQL